MKYDDKVALGGVLWFIWWIVICYVAYLETRDGGTPWAAGFFTIMTALIFFTSTSSNNDE